jgi:hypothetical protein
VNDGLLIEVVHGGDETILEFLFGCDADVTQNRARKFGEEALDKIEPGAVRRREREFEAAGRLTGKPGLCLFRNVGGMIVENQLHCGAGRIGGVKKLEKFNEFAASMAIPDEGINNNFHMWPAARRRHRPICAGSPMDGPHFVAYVEQILAPTLKKGQIVFLNNVSTHKVDGVEEAIESRDARAVFLPAYSPDLNPIEQLFARTQIILTQNEGPHR